MNAQLKYEFAALVLATLSWTPICLGQVSTAMPAPGLEQRAEDGQSAPAPVPASISGTVLDQSGAVLPGARLRVTEQNQTPAQEAVSGPDGQFSFAHLLPGPFQLTVTAAGFEAQTSSGVLHSGETYLAPPIALAVATKVSEVEVSLTRTEEAEKEIKVEEKQRVLGIVPNFYVSYQADAVSLTAKQKFELAWKSSIDPVTFVLVGAAAGVEQAQNHFSGFGQGAQGYGKRFGAGYADTVVGTYIGGAILPSLLKQDPRYFYKGTGSKSSRFFYALASAFVCKGDNGRWQVNYSNILGNLAAGGVSNLYYPAQNRNGLGLTLENASIGIGAIGVSNVLQEFVIRKFTPKVPKKAQSNP